MGRNLLYVAVLTVLWSSMLSAQQLSPSVISTSGGFYSNTTGMLSFTTGELAVTETYINNTAILTQGFQQPLELGVFVIEHPEIDFSYGLYPNPSNGDFYLMTQTELALNYDVQITDLLGRVVDQFKFEQNGTLNVHPVDATHLPSGTYLILLTAVDAYTEIEYRFIQKISFIK